MARCPCSCELPGKKKNSPRLTLQREIGRKHIFFIIVSVYMWGSQGRKVRNGKLRNGRAIFQKHLASFTVLNVHCHMQTFQDDFHFLCFFFSGRLLPPRDSDQRLCLYLPLLCTTSLYWTPYLISVSTGGSFARSHRSISGPRWLSREPTSRRPHHSYHCFHSVTLPPSSKDLTPPQSLPFPHTISPYCHNQGVSIRFCFLFFLILLNHMSTVPGEVQQ